MPSREKTNENSTTKKHTLGKPPHGRPNISVDLLLSWLEPEVAWVWAGLGLSWLGSELAWI